MIDLEARAEVELRTGVDCSLQSVEHSNKSSNLVRHSRGNIFRPFSQNSTPPPSDLVLSAFSPVRRLQSLRASVTQTLFQPFKFTPSEQQQQQHSEVPSHNTSPVLPFSVDNILRSNFGQRTRLLSSSTSSTCSSPFIRSPPPPSSQTSSPLGDQASIKHEPQSPQGTGDEDGVPPGMVRGPNGQLWPAWVFCTRYSDRPSSGEWCRHVKPLLKLTASK